MGLRVEVERMDLLVWVEWHHRSLEAPRTTRLLTAHKVRLRIAVAV